MSYFSNRLNTVMNLDDEFQLLQFERQWYSWRQMRMAIEAVAAAAADVAPIKDLRIGVMVRNHPAPLAAILAAMASEACMVSLNPMFTDECLAHDLMSLQLPVLVGLDSDLARPGIQEALHASGVAVIALSNELEVKLLSKAGEPSTEQKLYEPHTIVEMLTSGTTGPPKRIPLRRAAFDQSFISAMHYESRKHPGDEVKLKQDIDIISNPLSHIGGLWAAITSIAAGRRSVLLKKFSVEEWHYVIKINRPEVARATPAGLQMILDANIPAEDLASLRAIRTGAAPLDPEITDEFFDRYGIPLLQNYGATEFAGAVAGWTLKDFYTYHKSKRGSVGRLQPGVTGRVVDPESGEEKAPGEEGVLELQSAQFGNDGAWLRTTDRAALDADGFLFIRGRTDNVIIRGGFKVHPEEVTKVLESHPSVRDAAVVGIADRRLGAVPVAVIVVKANVDAPTEEELRQYAKERLIAYQVPVAFRFLDELPRTQSMKPNLPQIKQLFEKEAR